MGGTSGYPEEKLHCSVCNKSVAGDHVCPLDRTTLVRLDSDSTDPLLGRCIEGRFTIESHLATGGMGAVYRALQHSVSRQVALKVLRPRLLESPISIGRFFREAKLSSQIAHPNVVSVIDFGQTDDGLLYLATELIHGRTLKRVLKEDGPFEPARLVRVGSQICDALEAAHNVSIIHRDLKPANIMVLDGAPGADAIKVLDFGVAKSAAPVPDAAKGAVVTRTGVLLGTPAYTAPEAVMGTSDRRSDIYSLGVILHELIEGSRPFPELDTADLLHGHLYVKPPRATRAPPPLADLIGRMLEKDPARRPQSAGEVRAALRRVPTEDLSSGGLTSLATLDTVVPPPPPAVAARHRWWLLASAAIALVVIAGWIASSSSAAPVAPSAAPVTPAERASIPADAGASGAPVAAAAPDEPATERELPVVDAGAGPAAVSSAAPPSARKRTLERKEHRRRRRPSRPRPRPKPKPKPEPGPERPPYPF